MFQPLEPPEGYVYTPNPSAAKKVAALIEYNVEPVLEGLPPEWVHVVDAIEAVAVRGRRARYEAFVEATRGFSILMLYEVNACSHEVEDPAEKTRVYYTADDALSPPPELDWCVGGLFTRPSLNLLVGQPGTKKTYLSIDLAVSVAMGQPWLDHPVAQSPVVFIDEETGLSRLWGRFNAALRGHHAEYGLPLHYVSLGGYDLRLSEDADHLLKRCLNFDAQLIIIDTLAGVMRGADENSVLSVQPVLYHLRRLAEACRAAVLIVHHTNREGGFRGSSAIAAGVDLMLAIQSPPDEPLLQLETLKARNAAPPTLAAHAHFETDLVSGDPLFHLTAADEKLLPPEESQPVHWSQNALAVMRRIAQIGHATTDDLNNNLEIAPSTIRLKLHELMKGEMVIRPDGGAQGSRAIYELTPKGKEYVESQAD